MPKTFMPNLFKSLFFQVVVALERLGEQVDGPPDGEHHEDDP